MDKNVEDNYLALIELDAEEKIICSIRKHPIGLVGIVAVGIVVTGLLIGVGAYVAESSVLRDATNASSLVRFFATLLSIGLALASVIATYVAVFIYRHSILIITSDKVVQILYKSLLSRKVSQLSLGDVQDVTVQQKGLFPRLFKYGTLAIETAGEQDNYSFTYAPFPYQCSRELVGARESSIKKYGN